MQLHERVCKWVFRQSDLQSEVSAQVAVGLPIVFKKVLASREWHQWLKKAGQITAT